MGIHNEPGSGRAPLDLPWLVATMLAQLLDPDDADRAFRARARADVVLLVNNLGGVSVLEMGGVTAEVAAQLAATYGIWPVRVLSGAFMTSLNGPGFSISLLTVADTGAGVPGMLELLDAPIRTATWGAGRAAPASPEYVPPSGLRMDPEAARAALTRALQSVVAAEPDITRFDTVVGDGDCGVGLKRGAQAILTHIHQQPLMGDAVVASIVPVVETTMDGTSGALCVIFLNALVHALRARAPGDASPQLWAAALRQSCDALSKYKPARPGDRTLVDALYPFEELGRTGDVAKAAQAAGKAADETKGMQASLSRSMSAAAGTSRCLIPEPGASPASSRGWRARSQASEIRVCSHVGARARQSVYIMPFHCQAARIL